MKRFTERKTEFIQYGIYTGAYILAFLASRQHLYYLSGIVLMLVAAGLGLYLIRKANCLVEPEALFTLSWVGGQGIAVLQLSHLQKDWQSLTWICFFLAYFCFRIGYDFLQQTSQEKSLPEESEAESFPKNPSYARRILHCIVALAVVSVLCFIVEAVVVGFIPMFSDLPHAYSYFHISGVHYFTVSCILIPGMTILYEKAVEKKSKRTQILLILCNVVAFAIPMLCVSRFQLLFAVGFAVVIFIMVNRRIRWQTLLLLVLALIPLYAVLTVFRNHDVTYLNEIFEMKNKHMPIFISQPYIYVANNYENFNCMVVELTEHTRGMRMLFPFFALTGLKFVFPQLVSSPLFLTKTELTTLTVFYDAYYDFGIWGVLFLAVILGAMAKWLFDWVRNCTNPIACLFYGQIAIYLGLSFFTTWFSNPTTWFWLVLTGIMYVYVDFDRFFKNRKKVSK